MYSGNINCRPERYNNTPWEIYGFDNVDWKKGGILNTGEKCRIVKELENDMNSKSGL
jgi:hypothetical protein